MAGQSAPEPLRVMVVDGQDMFARSLELALPAASGGRIKVVATAGAVDEALAGIGEHHPDLALVDLGLAGDGALAIIRQFALTPDAVPPRMVGVGDRRNCGVAMAALTAGYDAVVTKEARPEYLLASILAVLQGWRVLSPPLLEGIMTRARRPGSEILADLDGETVKLWLLVAEGLELGRIAERLHVSERTAKRMVATLRDRLGATSRVQMAAMAGRAGLLDGDPIPTVDA